MFAQQLINGLMLGSVYALIAVGFTVIFGVMRMLNLAHAYIFMSAPFFAHLTLSHVGVPPLLACVAGIVCAGLLGVVLYVLCFLPIPQSNALGGFVTSLSFGVILQVTLVNWFGTLKIPFNLGIATPDLRIGSVILSGAQAASLVIALGLMAGLLVVLNKSRFGRNVRAVAENDVAARLLGISARRLVLQVFFLASSLAGLAGLLVAARFEVIWPYMSDTYALKALAVIVIGGLGDVRGAVLAGIGLGASEVMFQAYAPPGLAEAFVWTLVILVFLVKPEGLFGSQVQRREV